MIIKLFKTYKILSFLNRLNNKINENDNIISDEFDDNIISDKSDNNIISNESDINSDNDDVIDNSNKKK